MTTPEQVAEMTDRLTDTLQPVQAAVRRYRDGLIRDGWTPPAAERMAVQLHGQMMLLVLSPRAQ